MEKLLEELMAEHLIKLKGNLKKPAELFEETVANVVDKERVPVIEEVKVKEEEKAKKEEGKMVAEEGVREEVAEMSAGVDDHGKISKVEVIKMEPLIKEEYCEVGCSKQSVKYSLESKEEIIGKEVKADVGNDVDLNVCEMQHSSSDEFDDDPMQGGHFWLLRGSGIGDLRCTTGTRKTPKADDVQQRVTPSPQESEDGKFGDVGLFELCNPHLLSTNRLQRLLFPLHASPSSSGDVVQLARTHLSPKPQRRIRRRGGGFGRWEGEFGEILFEGKEKTDSQRVGEESLKRRLDFTFRNYHAAPVWDQRNCKRARYI